jgi:competence protein ComEC
MTATDSFSMLLRQRLPFLSLLGLVVCGIALAEHFRLTSIPLVVTVIFSAAVFFATARKIAFAALVLCVFGTLHVWQSRESQPARFAAWLGSRSLPAVARGIVTSEPRVFSEGRSSFEVRLSWLRVEGLEIRPSFRLLVEQAGPAPTYGDEVSLQGTLKNIESPRNPGQFDFAAWSARHGVFTQLHISHKGDAQILRNSQGNPLVSFALRTRAWLRQTLIEGVNDPTVSDLLVAMVLGDVSSLPQRIQEEFRGTGTFHLFSVSGLHVGMVCVLLWYVLKVLRIPRRHAAGWIIPLLFFYVMLAGLKAASVRSALMAAIVLLGMMANRRPVLFNNLCAAGFLILLADTNQLFNPGFQLSFLCCRCNHALCGPAWLGACRSVPAGPFSSGTALVSAAAPACPQWSAPCFAAGSFDSCLAWVVAINVGILSSGLAHRATRERARGAALFRDHGRGHAFVGDRLLQCLDCFDL